MKSMILFQLDSVDYSERFQDVSIYLTDGKPLFPTGGMRCINDTRIIHEPADTVLRMLSMLTNIHRRETLRYNEQFVAIPQTAIQFLIDERYQIKYLERWGDNHGGIMLPLYDFFQAINHDAIGRYINTLGQGKYCIKVEPIETVLSEERLSGNPDDYHIAPEDLPATCSSGCENITVGDVAHCECSHRKD